MSDRILRAPLAAMALVLLPLAGCDSLSDVGKLDDPEPRAIASSIGEAFASDGDGNITMTVRAGADVILSGKESRKGADDTGVPLIGFDWEQAASDAVPVHIVYRASNTVSFVAPQVATDTTLHFTLNVRDAHGATDAATATVLVKNYRDTDHFLQYLNQSDTIPVVLTTQTPIARTTAGQATDNLRVGVKVTKLLTFTDSNHVLHTRVPVGTSRLMATSWAAQLGTSSSCSATSSGDPGQVNPVINVPVPRLDQDDLLQGPVEGFPTAVVVSDVLEPSDINDDSVVLEMRLDIDTSPANTDPAVLAAGAALCINGEGTPSASGAIRNTEALLAVAANDNVRDSKAAAKAYYAAINPPSENPKDTLDRWLAENGFDPAVAGWNADAHATYTNDFDLGFGRDMYMKFGGKTGKCDDNTAPLPVSAAHLFGGAQGGNCDVAAVVVNYASVEAAIKKVNPVVVVAMEYSRVANAGSRFVKFYTFAPDRRSGEFRRVLSVNLDRRGEQFMPQACVVCHGGTPKALVGNAYPGNGNVNAAFLPWDLDSFLYSDTDPGFSSKSRDAALRSRYTRAQQEDQLRLLNVGAYMTMGSPDPTARYALGRDLIEHWYGGGTGAAGVLADATYDDTSPASVPAGWLPTNFGNPADSALIYREVFARNCRMCHTVQVPASGDPRQPSACAAGSPVTNSTRQVPMGCYWQFANAPFLAQALAEGRMPFARRSMDRLWTDTTQWVDATNTTRTGTKGELLYDHLRTVFTANNRTAQLAALAVPGSPQVSVALSPSTSDVFDWVATSAGSGLTNLGTEWLAQPSWRLCVPLTPATCAGASTVYPVVGGDSTVARLQVPRSGSYVVELRSATQPVASATIVIPDRRPAIKPLPGQVQRQGSITLNGDSLVTAGNGPTGNPLSAHKWWISNLSNEFTTSSTCTAATPCTVSGSTITLVAVSATASTGSYRINVIDADDAPGTPVFVTQNVTINSGLTVNGRTGRIAANASKGQVYLDSGTCLPTVSTSGCVALDLLQGNTAAAGSTLVPQFCAGTSPAQCATTSSAACLTAASTGCASTGSNYKASSGLAFLGGPSGLQLLYTPPSTYATHPPSGNDSTSPATRSADRLYYRLVRVDGSSNPLDYSAWTTLDIKVLARKSFPTDIVANIFQRNTSASAYPSGGSKCSTCHYTGYPGLPANALTFGTSAGANLLASDIYLQLVPSSIGAGGTSRTAVVQGNLTRPYIDLRAPSGPTANSTLFMHPADLDGYPTPHAGSNRCQFGEGSSTCDLTDVLTWIRDGANPF